MSATTTGQIATPITISFNEIPSNLLVPGTYIEAGANVSQQGLVSYPVKGLIIAPMLSTGTATAEVPVSIWSAAQAIAAFGAGSIGAAMATAWLAANPWTSFDALPVADPTGGVAAAGTLVVSGAPTASGNIQLYIDGTLVSVPVTAGTDTSATIATNIMAAVNSTAGLPVTATVALSTVTLTSRHLGLIGNLIPIVLNYAPTDRFPAGVTVVPTAMTGGSGSPTTANYWSAIAADRYTHAAIAWNDTVSLTATAAEMERRFNAMVGLDCLAFAVLVSPLSNLISQNAAPTSRFLYTPGVQNAPVSPWRMAAVLAAVAAFNLGNDPGRQLENLALPGILPPLPADRFDPAERQSLLAAGISTFTVDAGGTLRIERIVSTYLQTSAGVPDTSWQDITTASVVIRVRYDWIAYRNAVYPRNKLADDGSVAAEYDPNVVTPRRLWSSWGSRCKLYEQLGWIENSAVTNAASVFQRDLTNRNRVDARMQIQVIGNLMILAGQLEFSL